MPTFRVVRAWAVALIVSSLAVSACTQAGSPSAPRPAITAPAGTGMSRGATAPDGRERWLEMFARGYFPGRSGQIFLVPGEGDIITDRDELYGYMHGSPWDYDTHIPLLLHGAPFVKAGTYPAAARQQDLAPTLAALMDTMAPATMTGRVLSEALGEGRRPRVVIVMVLDAMRVDYFDRYADLMPTLTRLRREGAWFSNTRIDYLPTLTSVGHATIGTGTDPRIHGLAANTLFSRIRQRPQPAYANLDPNELMALTLADAWNLATDGQAIIVGQGGAIRATAGLVGRGSCLVNGRPVIAASYSTRDAGWETNDTCYRMPEYLAAINGRTFWDAAGGRWMNHDISNASKFRASSLFQRFEGEALAAVATNEAFGADDITDLLLVNMKGPDYVSHAYGPDSAEMREELAELDRQMTRLIEIIDRKAGPGGRLLAVTADHGMPSEPAPGRRFYTDDIVARIHTRFDPAEKRLVTFYGDAANNQIFIDTARLQSLGHSLADIAALLAAEPYVAAAFTEDEVRAAQGRLAR